MSPVFDHRIREFRTKSAYVSEPIIDSELVEPTIFNYILHLPPGPSEPPFGHHEPRKIAQWINEYGPVISLNKGKDVLVIVGRCQEAIDIMEKQGASLADRPRSVAGSEILGRRILTHTPPIKTYEPVQFAYAHNIVLDLLDSPTLHQLHIKRFAASVILRIVYGKTTLTLLSDPFLLQLQNMIPRFQSAMMPSTYLVDKYPILKYIPVFIFEDGREEEYEMLFGKLNWVKSQVESNVAADSVAKDLLMHRDDNQLSKMKMTYLSGSLIGAAADTTAVAISTVMMAAACFPCAQARIHSRSPTFEDWPRLVQPQAFILEALRWRPVNPIDGEIKDNMRLFTFGSGRRSMYIAIALLLWSFTLAEDPSNPIDGTAFTPGIVSHQKRFSLTFTPRMSETSLEIIFSSTG
ncbi:cytochrome P450 [Rhizopogon vinicolor AM-OR11-026]|uniref:Cytochrome P450 n=1 Tax=Rhizopogon vinicolor AM-OR11-026 TaxID=1314800 RepID=A0A1B7MWM7_9AGAM|nr:cytochrome P450 [Rhizopogon vinicolor AM-OR11-026]